jgi:hypothetical protein
MKNECSNPRRNFLKQSSTAAASIALGAALPSKTNMVQAAPVKNTGKITVSGNKVNVETHTLSAMFERGILRSLKSKITGEEYIALSASTVANPLSLTFNTDVELALGKEPESDIGSVTARAFGYDMAEFRFHGWNGDGILRIGIDRETGDMILEPSAYSSRPGVRACRYYLNGLGENLELVAPFWQGIKLDLTDPLIAGTHWTWPRNWEAGIAVLQSKSDGKSGFWVHTRDYNYRFKALKIGNGDIGNALGFDSEAYGPLDDNLSAGGVEWRVNVFNGGWQKPAEVFSDWLSERYNLDHEVSRRQEWMQDIRMAISWCRTDNKVLDMLAERVDPKKVLIHLPNWRKHRYDQNYPDYTPSEAGISFYQKGKAMGFHVMPHFNAIDMDPSHEVYELLRDFQSRWLGTKELWGWGPDAQFNLPESNNELKKHRSKNVMVKIHPGLGMWRSILCEAIQNASRQMGDLEGTFVDVTHNCVNLHNSIVENMTTAEGMNKLIHQVGNIGSGFVVGGEGLNEATFAGLSVAQAHLFMGGHTQLDGIERTGGCNISDILFGKVCKTIGYSGLTGRREEDDLRLQLHLDHGAIPTFTHASEELLGKPTKLVNRVFELANE